MGARRAQDEEHSARLLPEDASSCKHPGNSRGFSVHAFGGLLGLLGKGGQVSGTLS
jgi:hypothetical protein